MNEATSIRSYALEQIASRLDRLGEAVQRTASSQAPDSIHDLRVSIRRFSQGLRLFPDFLPADPVKRIRKTLRRMLDVTSEVRNRDIALQELGEDGHKKLKKSLGEARERYAAEFSALVSEWHANGFAAEWRTELALNASGKQAVNGGREETVSEHAEHVLPKLAAKYFRAGRKLEADSPEPADLHHFRVKTKQFRYALEIFQPLYRKAMEPRLAQLKEIQDQLGKVSDLYTIHALLKGHGATRKRLSTASQKAIRGFQSDWTGAFDARGESRAWKQLLRAPLASGAAPARKRSKVAAKRTPKHAS